MGRKTRVRNRIRELRFHAGEMTQAELATAAQEGANVKIVILNNNYLGMVRQWQQTFYGERYSSSNMQSGMPDFVKLASAYGVKGIMVQHRDDLEGAIAEMLAHHGPVLMDVHVRKDENCYPMVAPGKSNAQMLGLPQKSPEVQTIELIYCGSCGAKNPSSHAFCPECGTKL